jgi:hypothetical protein
MGTQLGVLAAMDQATTPPGLPRLAHRARADASRCATLARRWRPRGWAAGSSALSSMARLHTSARPAHRCQAPRQCSIHIISLHLLDSAGQLLRVLFLDRQGHISAEPHYLPRSEALLLAANQRRIWGATARIEVL